MGENNCTFAGAIIFKIEFWPVFGVVTGHKRVQNGAGFKSFAPVLSSRAPDVLDFREAGEPGQLAKWGLENWKTMRKI